ncbi:MAG TPA: nucleoside triphosphate pyrophosphohydrolase [Euzebyales bacterium]
MTGAVAAPARLVLIDTVDQLPGLLPLHAWSALSSTDLILVGDAAHPMVAHLVNADLRHEIVPEPAEPAALSRRDLLGGVDPIQRARVSWIIDRVREAGATAYVYGPGDSEGFTRSLGFEAARSQIEVEVVYFGVAPPGVTLLELVEVERRLRGPDGCPWDREQDHASLAPYAVEEVYELLAAITDGTSDDIAEELGDVLLQVVFHAQIADDDERFDIDAVARGIVDKLVRRHPHVFGNARADSAASVMANWEQLKAAEKPERDGVFDGIVEGQPSVALAVAVQGRAARHGFVWPDVDGAVAKVREELDEVAAASDERQAHEVGDLLLAVVALARHLEVDPELALRAGVARFRARFERAFELAGDEPGQLSPAAWLRLWDRAGPEAT